jgi:cytoskeletal protein CcmA (bactofilin family)
MKITVKFLTLFTLLVLLLVPMGSAYAQGPGPGSDGRVIFGSNFTLESGDTFDGDLVVFGGNVTIEKDATLNGDLVVIGGTITSSGQMERDVVVVGGQVKLEESAVVAGDVITIGGQLERAEGATVEGDVVNNVAPDFQIPNGRIPPVAPGHFSAFDDRCNRVAGTVSGSDPLYYHSPTSDRCVRLVIWRSSDRLGGRGALYQRYQSSLVICAYDRFWYFPAHAGGWRAGLDPMLWRACPVFAWSAGDWWGDAYLVRFADGSSSRSDCLCSSKRLRSGSARILGMKSYMI